jgi:hypothetical protein
MSVGLRMVRRSPGLRRPFLSTAAGGLQRLIDGDSLHVPIFKRVNSDQFARRGAGQWPPSVPSINFLLIADLRLFLYDFPKKAIPY